VAKSKFDTSFDFGANVVRKKKTASGGTKKRKGRRKLSEAQKYTAAMYMKPRRRR
jgi:hypothetical protein